MDLLNNVFETRLNAVSGKVQYIKGLRDKVLADRQLATEALNSHKHEADVLAGMKRLLEALSKVSQQHIKNFVEPLITEALEFVFNKGYKFGIEFEERRGQTEVDFVFKTKDGNVTIGELTETNGGGVVDVAALILRIGIAHVLKVQGPICADEPGSFVDEVHSSRFGLLVHEICHKFNRQIVVITHSQSFAGYGDRIYSVSQSSDGISHVTEGIV